MYQHIFDFMLNCDEVTISRTSMSTRVGVIQSIQWMNGELWLKLHGGGLYPLCSITVENQNNIKLVGGTPSPPTNKVVQCLTQAMDAV